MRFRKIIVAILSLIVLAAAIYWFSVTESFNEAKWKSPDSTIKSSPTRSDRQKMLRSTLKKIKGKSRAEIIQLLGEGNKVGGFYEPKPDLIYLLGPERGLGVDSEWLLLWVNKKEVLDRYQIVTD